MSQFGFSKSFLETTLNNVYVKENHLCRKIPKDKSHQKLTLVSPGSYIMFPLTFNIHEANLQTATDRCNQYADDTTLYAYAEFFWPKASLLNTLLLFSGSEEVHWRLNSTGQFPFVWLPLPSWQMDSVPFLANSVQHSTIMVYLPAVRSLHIDQGFPDPLVDCLCL